MCATVSADTGHNDRFCRGSKTVCVIGAGAAGLITARVLLQEGHKVAVYEQNSRPGGTWVLEHEPGALSTNPMDKCGVHSSMYASLRTNLPRDLMATTDFTFEEAGLGKSPLFPRHETVLAYLEAYLAHFDIGHSITYNTTVQNVEPISPAQSEGMPRWRVRVTGDHFEGKIRSKENGTVREFDAVCVANGHYSVPRIADVPDLAHFKGLQLHSHNYREPSHFMGKHVILIGASASGEDISREIAAVASRVVLSSRGGQGGFELQGEYENFTCQDALVRVDRSSGDLIFADGRREACDQDSILMHCSGYHYSFPFLESSGLISTEGGMVRPLYEHLMHVDKPNLFFIGIPYKVVPFPQFEVQARFVSRFLSGHFSIPDATERKAAHASWLTSLEERGIAKRHAHKMGDMQWDYNDRLARLGGFECLESWRSDGYKAAGDAKRLNPLSYRDKCEWRKPMT